jgi:lysyl-tRNA synthetase class 2
MDYQQISKTFDEQKLRKLEHIRELNIEPYPHIFTPNIHSVELLEKYKDLNPQEHRPEEIYTVAGRLMLRRQMGKVSFYDIHDEYGRIQIYIKTTELTSQENDLLPHLDLGDFIGIKGFVFKTKTGEISIHCQSLTLLTKSLAPMPEKFHGLTDLELRYRQRFVDMAIHQDVRDIFKKRCCIINFLRNYLLEHGFLEAETPILQPIYGGANAKPFTTHHHTLDANLFLRISPELYLKKLIAGGFEKVFEIAKNFRNEGCDATHNPEFTMLEWYEAYTDYHYQMIQLENMVENLVKKLQQGRTTITFGNWEIDYKTPWKRLTMWDAIRTYAQLEPDTVTREELFLILKQHQSHPLDEKCSKGELLALVFEATCEKNLIQPTFILDHPVEISPLTKKHRDPTKTGLVERFELFIAQKEIANCYSELNDPIDQGLRLWEQEIQRKSNEEAQPMDHNFLHCVEFGLPPLGGLGLGIDRLVMLLTNQTIIRDVLTFPLLKQTEEDKLLVQ